MPILRMLITIIGLLMLNGGASFAQTEPRLALVVGNANYVNFGKLRNPANDARAMATTLRKLGFTVIEQTNLTRRAMIQAARTFTDRLSPGGIGLLYYAGHGIQSQGSNYLLPVDVALAVEDDLRYEAIDLQDILNKLAEARVRLSLVILDACRDNPFKAFRSAAHGLAQLDPPRGSIIAYSTSPGKVAADGNGDNSVYTAELIKAMIQPGLRLLDVFEHVTDAVERQTGNAQTPWINSSFRGDFYFTGPTTITVAPPSQATEGQTAEIAFWQTIVTSTDPADFEAYLEQFPKGTFALLAKRRIIALRAVRPAAPGPQPGDFQAALLRALSMVKESERTSQAEHYISEKNHRAMAVAPHMSTSWRVRDEQDEATARTRALEACQLETNEPCMLIAVDDHILPEQPGGGWPTQPQSRVTYHGEFDPARVPVSPTIRDRDPVATYQTFDVPKALAIHSWGRIFIGIGDDVASAETKALKACNDDPDRNGRDGPCYLYTVGNRVVLPDRLTAPRSDFEAALRTALSMVKPAEQESQARKYIAEANHKAMAVAPNLSSSWRVWHVEDEEKAATIALEGCQIWANAPCMLVAVNNRILPKQSSGTWPTQPQARVAYRGDFAPDQIPALTPSVRASPTVRTYRTLEGPKVLAYHPWGRIYLGRGEDIASAERIALKACNDDSDRHGQNGPCFLYAIGNKVVLPDRLTEPSKTASSGSKSDANPIVPSQTPSERTISPTVIQTDTAWDGVWNGSWGGKTATKLIIGGGRAVEYDYRDAPQSGIGETTISGNTLTFGTPPNFIITLTKTGPKTASAHYHGPGGEADASLTKQ